MPRRSLNEARNDRRDEEGTALVELSLVMVLLLTLLLGMVCFGVLLYKRQTLVNAAAEGARAAVPIGYTRGLGGISDAEVLRQTARTQANLTLATTGRSCPALAAGSTSTGSLVADGVTCSFVIADCDGVANTSNFDDCLTVRIVLDNTTNALVPPVPIIAYAFPDSLKTDAVVRLGNCQTATVPGGGSYC